MRGVAAHFFASDVAIRKRLSEDAYLALFRDAGEARRAGEVSVWYLYSRGAARAIRDFCGPIEIVVLLRNPIDAMHSLHSQLVYTGDEPLSDFEAALAAESERARAVGREPGKRTRDAWLREECLCYRRVYSYPQQVERYLEVFGAERVRFVLFDDLARDPATACGTVLEFLGLDPSVAVDPGRHNGPTGPGCAPSTGATSGGCGGPPAA